MSGRDTATESASKSGEYKLLATLRAGSFFGERSLLTGQPASATVRSIDYSSMMVLRPAVFINFVRRFPVLKEHIPALRVQSMDGSTMDEESKAKSKKKSTRRPSLRP